MDQETQRNTTPRPREIVRNESWRMAEVLSQRPNILFDRVKTSVSRPEFDRLCQFIKNRLEGLRSVDGKEIAKLDNYYNIFKEMLREEQFFPGEPIQHIDEKFGSLVVELRAMANED